MMRDFMEVSIDRMYHSGAGLITRYIEMTEQWDNGLGPGLITGYIEMTEQWVRVVTFGDVISFDVSDGIHRKKAGKWNCEIISKVALG